MIKPEGESIVQWEWILYVDGSSNGKGSRVEEILEGSNDMTLEYSLKFYFQEINNQAEYDVLVTDLQLAKEVNMRTLRIRSDS